jgi:rubrerythrin
MTKAEARGDAPLFYSMAISAFIESTTPHYVVQLRQIFQRDAEFICWLEGTWQREEVGHGRCMREQIERIWPEFDYDAAYAAFARRYVPRCDVTLLRPTPALESLARCVTEAHAAGAYRALAGHCAGRGVELPALFLRMAAHEARHYSYFRRTFERYNAVERQPPLRRLRVVLARALLVRDEDLPLGFAVLNAHWREPPPFQRLSYRRYQRRIGQVMRDNFPVEATLRMLLKVIGARPRMEQWLAATLPRLLGRRPARPRSAVPSREPGWPLRPRWPLRSRRGRRAS